MAVPKAYIHPPRRRITQSPPAPRTAPTANSLRVRHAVPLPARQVWLASRALGLDRQPTRRGRHSRDDLDPRLSFPKLFCQSKLQIVDYQFGVHLSHKITPLPPIENFSAVIGLSIVLSPPARRRLPTRSAALWPSLAALRPLSRFLCHSPLLFLPQFLLISLRPFLTLLLGEIRAVHPLVLPMPLWLIRRVVVPR